jgi:hydroxylaminobenzene mutase
MTDVLTAAEAAAQSPARHPLDPDPVHSTKAAAVLALGVAAVVTGPLVGGIVPATLGLTLARQARGDLIAGRGYLTGARQLRIGLMLAWIGIGLAAAALVVASIVGLISLADGSPQDFPDISN